MVVIQKKQVKRIVLTLLLLLFLYYIYDSFYGATYATIHTPKPVFGNKDASVKIIEFSDLQCPACRSAQSIINTLKEEFKQNISFEYYHFPLTAIHPYAQKAAEATECANDQGKFWEYIDASFQLSPDLHKRNLKKIAQDLQLNMDNFTACLDSNAKKAIVQADYSFGVAKNVQGTPTIFINGKKLDKWDYTSFKEAIEKELKKK